LLLPGVKYGARTFPLISLFVKHRRLNNFLPPSFLCKTRRDDDGGGGVKALFIWVFFFSFYCTHFAATSCLENDQISSSTNNDNQSCISIIIIISHSRLSRLQFATDNNNSISFSLPGRVALSRSFFEQ
jgi:hypothetical protein